MVRRLTRLMLIAVLTVFLGFGLLAGCLIVQQEKLIYMPRAYSGGDLQDFEREGYVALVSETASGRQVAFFKAPRKREEEAFPVWLVFSGNGGCAMDYTSIAEAAPGTYGWLFVDYPGYGACQGSPNPESIRANGVTAVEALARHLEVSSESLRPRLGVFGHSIGGAVALDLAAHLRLQRAVTVSTFTSMKAMAARIITPMLTPFLRHRFDNIEALELLAGQSPVPRVHVLHGTQDAMIPSSMGETLVERFPEITEWTPIEGAGHNDIIDLGEEEIVGALEWER